MPDVCAGRGRIKVGVKWIVDCGIARLLDRKLEENLR